MMYDVKYTKLSEADLTELDSSRQKAIKKAIDKVAKNPLPKNEGGYGEPLGHKHGKNLTGYCKIKLLKLGIRVVYKIVKEDGVMRIIVIAARADDEVYDIAAKRIEQG